LSRTRLLALPAALLVAVSLAACGGGGDGGGGSSEDAQAVLDRTFNNGEAVKSGTFDLSLNVKSEGDQGGELDATIGGPFQSRDGDIPAFDVTGSVKVNAAVQDLDVSGGLLSTGQAAFITYQDKDYQVPQEAFDAFAQRFIQLQQQSKGQSDQSGNFLKSLGVDPSAWLTGLKNEGTEDVEGTNTIHISGDADIPKLIEDLQKVAQNAGPAAQQIDPAQLSQLEGIVKEAHFDVYSGSDDNLLHKLDASINLEAPAGTPGASGAVSIDFSLTLSDINQPQTVEAPTGAEPLDSLLQQFGLDPSVIQGALGGSSLPQAGGSPSAPGAGATDAYLQCLQTAQGAAETQACAALL
jgi:hypothetical protein